MQKLVNWTELISMELKIENIIFQYELLDFNTKNHQNRTTKLLKENNLKKELGNNIKNARNQITKVKTSFGLNINVEVVQKTERLKWKMKQRELDIWSTINRTTIAKIEK